MEHLANEVARLARQVQLDIEGLGDTWSRSNDSAESINSTSQALDRIEQKLGEVHGDTEELIRRVPEDIGPTLTELRRALLLRLREVLQGNQSVHSLGTGIEGDAKQPSQSLSARVRSLTPQEKRVFQLCFQSGFLTYREIAEHLDITPSAAKNLVNRMFQSDRKRPLFAKQYSHGKVRVGVRPVLEKRILVGGSQGKAARRKAIELEGG